MSLARKGLFVSLGAYATMAVQFGQAMVLARALGADGVGRLSLFRTTFVLGYQIASLGLPVAMIREINKGVPAYMALTSVIRATQLLSILAVGVLALVMAIGGEGFFGELNWTIYLSMILLVPFCQLKDLFISFNAIDLDARRMTVISFLPPLALALWYLAAWRLSHLNVNSAVLAESLILGVGAGVLALGLSAKAVKAIKPAEALDRRGWFLGMNWKFILNLAPFGLQLAATDFMMLLNGYVMLAMLRLITHDFEQVGFYSRGLRLSTLTLMAIFGLQRLVYSNWSKFEGEQLKRSVERVVNACFVISVLVGILMAFAAKPLMLLMSGREFLPAVPLTRVTLIGISVYIVSYMLLSFFNAMRKSYYNLVVLGVGTLANVIFGLLLIPGMQATGAAWAVNFGYLAMTVAALYIACRHCGLRLGAMLKPSPALAAALYRALIARRSDT